MALLLVMANAAGRSMLSNLSAIRYSSSQVARDSCTGSVPRGGGAGLYGMGEDRSVEAKVDYSQAVTVQPPHAAGSALESDADKPALNL